MAQATYDSKAKALYIYLRDKKIPEGMYLNTLYDDEIGINLDELRLTSTSKDLRGIEGANLEGHREFFGIEILGVELEDITERVEINEEV